MISDLKLGAPVLSIATDVCCPRAEVDCLPHVGVLPPKSSYSDEHIKHTALPCRAMWWRRSAESFILRFDVQSLVPSRKDETCYRMKVAECPK